MMENVNTHTHTHKIQRSTEKNTSEGNIQERFHRSSTTAPWSLVLNPFRPNIFGYSEFFGFSK